MSRAEPDEQVRRDGEDVPGLAEPAKVAEGDEDDRADADDDPSSATSGTAEMICSTAEAVDTATVMT